MDHVYTRSGNVIAKDSKVQGASYIVNQGSSYIGHGAGVHGERNNGKPIISWGKIVILSDESQIMPAERKGKFLPMSIGHHVFIGKSTVVEAAAIGSHTLIGRNCRIGKFAILKDCVIVPDNSVVPDYAVVGPSCEFRAGEGLLELPEAAADVIDHFCENAYRGIRVEFPEF